MTGSVRHRKLSNIEQERQRESVIVALLISNFLHDKRLLDPTALVDDIDLTTVNAVLDGNISARICIEKKSYGPVWVEWRLWPDGPGRPTWGTITISRLSPTKALLESLTYERSKKRSLRLHQICLPDAKWGLKSAMFDQLRVSTTF